MPHKPINRFWKKELFTRVWFVRYWTLFLERIDSLIFNKTILGISLSNLVALIFVLIILFSIVASYFTYRSLIQQVESENMAAGSARALMAAYYVANHQENFINRLNATVANPSFTKAFLTDNKQEIRLHLNKITIEYSELDAIVLVDVTGRELYSFPDKSLHPVLDTQSTEWFKHVKMTSFHYVSDVSRGWLYPQKKGIILATPVLNQHNNLLGILAVFQRLDLWENFLFLMTKSPGFGFWLIDRSGNGIAGWGAFGDGHHALLKRISKRLRARRGEKVASRMIFDPNSNKKYYISTAIIPVLGWSISITRDYQDAMTSIFTMTQSQKIFVALLVISLLLLAFLLFSRNQLQQQALLSKAQEARRLENLVEQRTFALSRSRQRYRNLLEGVPDIVYEIDARGRITFVSEAMAMNLKYSPDEIMGKPWRDLILPEDRNQYDLYRRESEQGRIPEPIWLRHVAKDGEIVWLSTHTRLYFERHTNTTCRLAVARNVNYRVQAEKRVRELSRQLLKAHEAERKRLALDLHDEMGQTISLIKLKLEDLLHMCSPIPVSLEEKINDLLPLTKRASRNCRDLAYRLWPAALDRFGLGPAILDMCENVAVEPKVEISTNIPAWDDLLLKYETKITMFRFLQESLTNALKHSGSGRVEISCELKGNYLIGSVRDYGCGFNSNKALRQPSSQKSLGLMSMAERLKLVGGQLVIDSNAQGTIMKASVPVGDFAPETRFDISN